MTCMCQHKCAQEEGAQNASVGVRSCTLCCVKYKLLLLLTMTAVLVQHNMLKTRVVALM